MARDFTRASSQYLWVTSPVTAPPFTVNLWFRVKDDTQYHSLLSIGNTGTSNHYYLLNAAGGIVGDPLQLWIQAGGGGLQVNTTNAYTANTWHMATLIETTVTNHVSVLDNNWASRGSSTTNRTVTGINNLSIGVSAQSVPSNYIDGAIANVALWTAALTSSDLDLLWNGGVMAPPIRQENLLSFWPLFPGGNDMDVWRTNDLAAVNSPAYTTRHSEILDGMQNWAPPPITTPPATQYYPFEYASRIGSVES